MLLRLYTYYADFDPNHNKPVDAEYSQVNGNHYASMNGHAHSGMPDDSDRQIRDAEEFELDGLTTDDEDDAPLTKKNGVVRA